MDGPGRGEPGCRQEAGCGQELRWGQESALPGPWAGGSRGEGAGSAALARAAQVTSQSSRAQPSLFPGRVASGAIFRTAFCFFFPFFFSFPLSPAPCCPRSPGEREREREENTDPWGGKLHGRALGAPYGRDSLSPARGKTIPPQATPLGFKQAVPPVHPTVASNPALIPPGQPPPSPGLWFPRLF